MNGVFFFIVGIILATPPCPTTSDANECGAARVGGPGSKTAFLNCIFDGTKASNEEKCYQLKVGKLDVNALNNAQNAWKDRIEGARGKIETQDIISFPDGTVQHVGFSADGVSVLFDKDGKVKYGEIEQGDKQYIYTLQGDTLTQTAENDVQSEGEDDDEESAVALGASPAPKCKYDKDSLPNDGKTWLIRTKHYYTEGALERLRRLKGLNLNTKEKQLKNLFETISLQLGAANEAFRLSGIPLRLIVGSLEPYPYTNMNKKWDIKPTHPGQSESQRDERKDFAKKEVGKLDAGPKKFVFVWCNTYVVSKPGLKEWWKAPSGSEITTGFAHSVVPLDKASFISETGDPDYKRVVLINPKPKSFTLIHELGHIMGLSHNAGGGSGSDGNCPGCGIIVKCGKYRTIMAYRSKSTWLADAYANDQTCSGQSKEKRISLFSSKTRTWTDDDGDTYQLGNEKADSRGCILHALKGMNNGDIDPCNELETTNCKEAGDLNCAVIEGKCSATGLNQRGVRLNKGAFGLECALEGKSCSCDGEVRFCAGNSCTPWTSGSGGSVQCSSDVLGTPPGSNQLKRCLCKTSTSPVTWLEGLVDADCVGGKRKVKLTVSKEILEFDPSTCSTSAGSLSCTTTGGSIFFDAASSKRVSPWLKNCNSRPKRIDPHIPQVKKIGSIRNPRNLKLTAVALLGISSLFFLQLACKTKHDLADLNAMKQLLAEEV